MGAGILPVAITKKTTYFLFGLEEYGKKWSDFGGAREKNETRAKTAAREGYEETDGFLGSENYLTKKISDNRIEKLNNHDNTYTSYLIKINYNEDLPVYFNNHHKFIKHKMPNQINKKGLFEKSKMQWFTKNEIKENIHTFRPHYRDIARQILTLF